ncbi:MAG: 23S rRNA (adenine(2503)-C(2))-methyltransferase RlmN [Akkermansiaceae bacterium]|nr:23S rRNA (adenine(2503)-C(2))-methyltransferase RlmN [Akkermansiaceae bacterium]
MTPCILSLTEEELTAELALLGHKAYRARQIREWVWRRRARSFDAMTDLPPLLRKALGARFTLRPSEVVELAGSGGGTRKFLSRMEDGSLVESVLIPAAEGKGGMRAERLTLCVSSQVGCAFGCKFCASGLQGLERNLSAGEILGQIVTAEDIAGARIDNIVFMGMGEPLANFDNLRQALEIILSSGALNIGARHITVSTSGNVPGLKRLTDYGRPIRLAVSLHGVTDAVRSRIMPVNRRWPLGKLIPALKDWCASSSHKITLEYILIEGINDTLGEAELLAGMARDLRAKVNLIPYNTVDSLPWKRPSEKQCRSFCRLLVSRRIPVTLRYEKGHDINAACGQLRLRKLKE